MESFGAVPKAIPSAIKAPLHNASNTVTPDRQYGAAACAIDCVADEYRMRVHIVDMSVTQDAK
jgi:hypothetical protein